MNFSAISERLSGSPFAALPLLFLAGVLTSLTPCIYPMIPITAAIVGGGSDSGGAPRASRLRPLLLSLTYVVGLSLVYAGLGLFAGLSGTMFGRVSTNPWLYFAMANLLVVSALAMFDILPVRLPAFITKGAASVGTGGRFGGVFAMGAMSGLVAAPCSAPVMIAVLTWVTETRSGLLGFVYLFTFSLGMCALLVLVGVSSGTVSRLPKAGMWMIRVKKFFGIMMLGVAEYYLIKMGQLLI